LCQERAIADAAVSQAMTVFSGGGGRPVIIAAAAFPRDASHPVYSFCPPAAPAAAAALLYRFIAELSDADQVRRR